VLASNFLWRNSPLFYEHNSAFNFEKLIPGSSFVERWDLDSIWYQLPKKQRGKKVAMTLPVGSLWPMVVTVQPSIQNLCAWEEIP
jgi:hypothetical protein